MNEQTTKLIQELADKLGTTAEHLWAVLVRQAPISAAWDLIYLFLMLSIAAGSFVMSRRFLVQTIQQAQDSDDEPTLFKLGISTAITGIIALVALIECAFAVGSFGMTLAGFFNPEYWALKQILR